MLVLETSYLTLGVSSCRQSVMNAPVGFFVGSGGSLMSSEGTGSAEQPSVYSGTSGALSVASGRVSFTLGLTGPCLTLDTACSSSLVANHSAVSAITLIECPDALSTGVGMLTVGISNAFSAAGMLSAFGRCHTFDRRADGYCRGEACGSFLLSCNAEIIIHHTAVQHDGPSASLTAPNGLSQRRLIEAVQEYDAVV